MPKIRGLGSITPYRDGYRARIYVGGRRRERAFEKKGDAERWLTGQAAQKVDELAGFANRRGTREDVTFEDIADETLQNLFARRTYTERTEAAYRSETKQVLGHWGNRRVAAVRDRDVDAWVEELRKTYSTSSVRHYLDRLSQMLDHAQRQGYVGKLLVRIERPRLVQKTIREGITAKELARLIQAAHVDHDRRALPALLLAARTGLRATEICQLRGEDVYPGRRYIRVEVRGEKADRPKTATARTLPIEDADLLAALRALARKPGDPLLGLRTRDALQSLLARAWRAAGLSGAPQLHRLRHTYATSAALRMPVPVLQQRLGHRTILTTMRYVHVDSTTEFPPSRKGNRKKARRGADRTKPKK